MPYYGDSPDQMFDDLRATLLAIHAPGAIDPTGPQPTGRAYHVHVACDQCGRIPVDRAGTHPDTHPGHVVTVVEQFTTVFRSPGRTPR